MHRRAEEESAAISWHSIIDQRDYRATFKMQIVTVRSSVGGPLDSMIHEI